MSIRQLPEHLANKIAAGEVVERPASVVKELIENSIDASSKRIKVEVEEAGLRLIRVTDDGFGMSESDCKKAFMRHATSKIRYDSDLFRIQSLGFRGEALASIASVSKLTLKSSQGDEMGTSLYVEAGEIVREERSDARRGTEISVEQLFYNTPARLKYVKSIHTELSHITDLLYRYALAHPDIRFELIHNGKKIFSSTGSSNQLHVIAQIYGHQVARQMIPIEGHSLDFHVSGYIAKPEVTRSNRSYITTIVNGRYIKSPALTHAVIRAYDTLLPLHRYPIAVISIKLDPILVDVNVHPTKLEVRFSKETELVRLVENLIQTVFKEETLIPSIEVKNSKQHPKEQTTQTAFTLEAGKNEINANHSNTYVEEFNEQQTVEDLPAPTLVAETEQSLVLPNESEQMTNAPLVSEKKDDEIHSSSEELKRTEERIPMLYPIGQLQGTYILAQNEQGFYMIDQHAAQERIKYELYKEKLKEPANELQQLLIPYLFEFTTNEASYIEKNRVTLQQVGLHLEPFGQNTYAIRAFPNWFPEGLEEHLIRDMIEQVVQEERIDIGILREEMAIMMACKRSIKANHYLTKEEMERLLHDLRKTDDPFTCPHGRPVIIQFTFYEIEKMFKRVM